MQIVKLFLTIPNFNFILPIKYITLKIQISLVFSSGLHHNIFYILFLQKVVIPMTHTKMFIELLAPLFIAVLTIAGLAALVKWQVTPAAVGLGTLGAAGLVTVVVSGLVADLWTHRHTPAAVKSQVKNR